MKKNIPFAYTSSIYDIDPNFYVVLGVKNLLVDLDNTLDTHKTSEPTIRAINLKTELEKRGIRMIIISNNRERRVKTYANRLGVECSYSSLKPFIRRTHRFLSTLGVKLKESLYIGDQVINDINFGNKLGVKTILSDPLETGDQPLTKIVRLWDRPLRKKLTKKNLLRPWREVYEQYQKS